MDKRIVLVALLLVGIYTSAYILMIHSIGAPPTSHSYSFWRQISLVGVPGMFMAFLTMHGYPESFAEFLVVSGLINFALYLGIGFAARSVWRMFRKWTGHPASE